MTNPSFYNLAHNFKRYYWGRKGESDLFLTRNYFFEVVKINTPEVIEELFDNCYDLFVQEINHYREWFKKEYDHSINSDDPLIEWCHWENLLEASEQDDRFLPIVNGISEWADKYNLTDIWLLDAATVNLTARYLFPDIKEKFPWLYPGTKYFKDGNLYKEGCIDFFFDTRPFFERAYRIINEDECPMVKAAINANWDKDPLGDVYKPPSLPEFDPKIFTKKEYKNIANKKIDNYIDFVLATAKEEGFVPNLKKRKRGLNHFEWLVLFQVKGMSYKDICEELINRIDEDEENLDIIDESTIIKGIHNTAETIQIKPRIL